MRFGLLFERFLNPERVSMPDFDIDFCQDRRDEVIAYVRERYGADRVAQIITFGSFLARGVLRNVGRVLEMPLGQVDKLAKLVPQNPANPVTLKQAVDGEPRLQRSRRSRPARRAAARHRRRRSRGSIPTPRRMPPASSSATGRSTSSCRSIAIPKSEMPATQFNMKWVEPAGLVKFDFLGLKTLTVLSTCVELLAQARHSMSISARSRSTTRKPIEMLGRGETVGVFQVESARHAQGARRHARRPLRGHHRAGRALPAGPDGQHSRPIARASSARRTPITSIRKLEPVLKETFGVIIYQEQVMQIAQILSGYSLGEADLLRRAMGKKIKAEMDAQRERFVTRRGRARHRRKPRPTRFSTCWPNSPITASTRAMPRPMR